MTYQGEVKSPVQMEERMTEEFILEEDESPDGLDRLNRRPFLIAVGGLAIVGILAVACIFVVLSLRGPSARGADQIAAIETQNAIIAVTNEAVTLTIAALETEAARPTDTPRPTATNTPTPIPTETPTPTNTPVVQQAEEEEESLTGTTVFGSGGLGISPTPIGPLGGGEEGTLPQTGIATWGASVAALLLIAILFAARRLRSS
jgi:type IV secretory pathway VirB10-like protein